MPGTEIPHLPSLRATNEATSNPESPLHGHKEDKIGDGKTKDNQRLVDLSQLSDAPSGASWLTFLNEIKQKWLGELERTQDGSAQREALYRRLVGKQKDFSAHNG